MTTTTATVGLPEAGGGWREIELSEPRAWAEHPQPFQSRIAFAAACPEAELFGGIARSFQPAGP